jgi:tetratricopeptide (TPR) repeat protein
MIAINYQQMADIFKDQEDKYEQAIKCYQKSLQIMKMVYVDNPFAEILAVIHLNMAFVYKKHEEYAKEIESYCQALLIKQEIYRENIYHPELVALYNFLATAYENNRQYEQAIKYYHVALKSSEIRNLQGDALYPHDFLIILHTKLANLYAQEGKREKTKYHCDMTQLLRNIYESAAPDIPLISEAYSRIGKINLALQQNEPAIKDLYRSLNLQLTVYADNISDHPEIAQNYLFLTMAYSMKQELKSMLGCIIKAYKIIMHHPDHPEFSQINDMFTQHIIPLFAEHYSLDIDNIKRKIFEYIDQDHDFMNPYLHYSKAEPLYDPSYNGRFQDAIQNYVLALALLPSNEAEMRSAITLKLSSLGVSTSLDQIGEILLNEMKDSINSLEEPEFYYAKAESYNITEESIQNSRDAIIEYLLTLVLLTEDEDYVAEDIQFKLIDLGMSYEQLESWLPILQINSLDRDDHEVQLSGNLAMEHYS